MGKTTTPSPPRHDWTDYEGYVWAAAVLLVVSIAAIVIIETSRFMTAKDARIVEAKTAVCQELEHPDDVLRCMEKI